MSSSLNKVIAVSMGDELQPRCELELREDAGDVRLDGRLADERGLGAAGTKTGEVVAWLKTEYALGHGHAMAIAQVIKHRETVDIKNAETTPEPPVSIGRLWLDGKDTRPW